MELFSEGTSSFMTQLDKVSFHPRLHHWRAILPHIIMAVLLLLLLLVPTAQCRHKQSHSTLCDIVPDTKYLGYLVDCSWRHFTSTDLKSLKVEDATTLVLSYNIISTFLNNSFTQFPELRRLICSHCVLHTLDHDALAGLNKLEVLELDNNILCYNHFIFGKGFFRHVPKLKSLNIMNNANSQYHISNYSHYVDIFKTLPELKNLSIDAAVNLKLGEEFADLKKLTSLRVNCEWISLISNESLVGLQYSKIIRFELICGGQFIPVYSIGFDVFQFLPRSLSYFAIHALHIGNQNALYLFKGLTGRQIDTILLNATFSSPHSSFDQQISDGLVTTEASKYIRNICVRHFFWYDSRIVAVETDAPMSPTWESCLETLFLETDPIFMISNVVLFFKATHLTKLRRFEHLVRGNKLITRFWEYKLHTRDIGYQTGFNSRVKYLMEPDKGLLLKKSLEKLTLGDGERETSKSRSRISAKKEYFYEVINRNMQNETLYNFIGVYISNDEIDNESWTGVHDTTSLSNNMHTTNQRKNSTSYRMVVRIRLPPELRKLAIDGYRFISIDHIYNFWPNNLTSISITNSDGQLSFLNSILGLDKVESIDFQGSRLRIFPKYFAMFPSLKKLILRKALSLSEITLNDQLKSFQSVPLLEYLDLADNNLKFLQPDVFRVNTRLKYLCLASNMLSGFPFDLRLTPKLEILDLRGNTLPGLTDAERRMIDQHIRRVENFTILFSHNELSCTCSWESFTIWLYRNGRYFDHNGNYTCLAEDGTFKHTGSFNDPIAFHRYCQGYYQFMWTLVILCALLAVYLGMFLGMKHRTQIVAKVLQVISPGFRVNTRQDFFYDVFVGYSPWEGTYVRQVLLSYLEESWGLTTFIHQRDLLHDRLLMLTALGDSWRTLLVITENFLDNYDMAYNVMKNACFFVSPSNPSSVVVIVEEDVQHRIPDYVLRVVDDDNIIVLPKLQGRLPHHDEETLKSRLLR